MAKSPWIWLVSSMAIVIQSAQATQRFVSAFKGEMRGTVIECHDKEDCLIVCAHQEACADSTFACPSSGKCTILCNGIRACAGMSVTTTHPLNPLSPDSRDNGIFIECNAHKSCRHLDISVEMDPDSFFPEAVSLEMHCNGDHACSKASLNSLSIHEISISCANGEDTLSCDSLSVDGSKLTGDLDIHCSSAIIPSSSSKSAGSSIPSTYVLDHAHNDKKEDAAAAEGIDIGEYLVNKKEYSPVMIKESIYDEMDNRLFVFLKVALDDETPEELQKMKAYQDELGVIEKDPDCLDGLGEVIYPDPVPPKAVQKEVQNEEDVEEEGALEQEVESVGSGGTAILKHWYVIAGIVIGCLVLLIGSCLFLRKCHDLFVFASYPGNSIHLKRQRSRKGQKKSSKESKSSNETTNGTQMEGSETDRLIMGQTLMGSPHAEDMVRHDYDSLARPSTQNGETTSSAMNPEIISKKKLKKASRRKSSSKKSKKSKKKRGSGSSSGRHNSRHKASIGGSRLPVITEATSNDNFSELSDEDVLSSLAWVADVIGDGNKGTHYGIESISKTPTTEIVDEVIGEMEDDEPMDEIVDATNEEVDRDENDDEEDDDESSEESSNEESPVDEAAQPMIIVD